MFVVSGGLFLAVLSLGVAPSSQSARNVQWLPCQFVDESIHINAEGHRETKYHHRNAAAQFGSLGDQPIHHDIITFLVIASKVDMRHYVEGGEDTLQCEIRRYDTGGIFMRWPGFGAQEHDIWFTCTLTHTEGLFVITTFLRHTPAQKENQDWVLVADRELLTTSGVYMQGTTEDGLGLMFGVNHIGHFLLTNLLLDRLKECGPSRIVNVSSMLHQFGNLDFSLLGTHKEFGTGSSALDVMRIYCNSKLCNVLFTHELARRLQGTNVTCYSLHPGVINSDLGRNTHTVLKRVLKPIAALFFKDVEAGAQTTLHCAVQEGIEGLSGQYFSNCAPKKVQPKARDDAVAKKLWEVSEKLSGLS